QVDPPRVDSAAPQRGHEPVVDTEPDVGAGALAQVPLVQRARAAAQLDDARSRRDLLGDDPHPLAVVATVQRPHQQLVTPGAAVDEACAHGGRTVPDTFDRLMLDPRFLMSLPVHVGRRTAIEARSAAHAWQAGMLQLDPPARTLAIVRATGRLGQIGGAITAGALRYGERVALVDELGPLTFAELD